MLQTIKLESHVVNDGMLHIALPEVQDADVEVILVYQQKPKADKLPLASLYGICADDSIIIDDKGVIDNLDEKITGMFD